MRIQPSLSVKEAKRLSGIFVSEGSRCGISWRTLASIAFNESSLGLFRHNPKSHDHGLMQINIRNIEKRGLSAAAVQRDDALSVRLACEIIRANRDAYALKFPQWLGTYRSGTRLSDERIRKNAASYDSMIRKTSQRIASYEQDSRT